MHDDTETGKPTTDVAETSVVDPGSLKHRSSKAIDVKGNMYTLMSVVLRVNNLKQIRYDLIERVTQAPAFFKNTPVIVDFSEIEIDADFDFNSLFKTVRQQQLLPVAVRGISKSLHEQFQSMGVPMLELSPSAGVELSASAGNDNPVAVSDQKRKNKPQVERLRQSERSVVVDTPIRSGQQCAALAGDLVITSSCNPGAELVADGNIHVYGTLRGRAMCGVHGDENARIFCSSLEAQLVSVAGHYKILKEIPDSIKNKPVQISFKDGQLFINPL